MHCGMIICHMYMCAASICAASHTWNTVMINKIIILVEFSRWYLGDHARVVFYESSPPTFTDSPAW